MLDKKPYLIDAIRNWIIDSNCVPYLLVKAEGSQVPPSSIKNGKVVLNVSPTSTNLYCANQEAIAFDARFNGISYSIFIPMKNVLAIYARESGEGMFFDELEDESIEVDNSPAGAMFDFSGLTAKTNVPDNNIPVSTVIVKQATQEKPKPRLSVVKKDT